MSNKSAVAKLIKNMFVILFNDFTVHIENITRLFPIRPVRKVSI